MLLSASNLLRFKKILGITLISIAAAVAGYAIREAVVRSSAHPVPVYFLFCPPVMVVGIWLGLWPGVLTTLAAAVLIANYVLPLHSKADDVALAVFVVAGIFMSITAELYRRFRDRKFDLQKREAIRASELRAEQIARDAEQDHRLAEAIQRERQRLRNVLDDLSIYVVLLGRDYTVPFANRYFERVFGKSEGRLCYQYLFHRTEPCENCESFKPFSTNRPHAWEWLGPDQRNYEIHDVLFTDHDGSQFVLETGLDITERKIGEQALERLNRALRAITNCQDLLLHATDEHMLLEGVCRVLVEQCGYQLAWVGRAEPNEDRTVTPIAAAGEKLDYVRTANVTWSDTDRGRGPTGTSIRTGKTVVLENALTDPRFEPWREPARNNGFGSAVCLPIDIGTELPLALSIYRVAVGAFSDEELVLLERLAGNIGFGIRAMRMRTALERNETDLRERLKEMSCLYRVSEIARTHKGSINELLQAIATVLPPAFLYPDLAGARIALPGLDERTANYRDTPWKLSRPILMDGQRAGTVEVSYAERTPELDEGPFFDEEGALLSAIATVIENSVHRIRAEEASRASEARYRDLFENAPMALWEEDLSEVRQYLQSLGVTTDGLDAFLRDHPDHVAHCIARVRVVEVNETSLRTFGAPDKEALRAHAGQLFPPECYDVFQTQLVAFARGMRSQVCEMPRRTMAGELRQFLVRWDVQHGHEDTLDRVLVSLVDITALRQLEQQFRHAQKMEAVGRLAGGIAHDFNNLMGVVFGYTDLLLESVGDDQPRRKQLLEIKKAADRAVSLTRQLLMFSRKQVVQKCVVNLNEVVRGLEKMLRQLIGEDIDLQLVLEPALGTVTADSGQIEQVLMNLVINARDAMPNGGTICIETRNVEHDEPYIQSHVAGEPGAYVLLSVSDTGIGIDKAMQAHIFEPFFTTKDKDKGTGLGLATAYGIVKQHDGFIWVYSEPGQGSTFKIYLRRVDAKVPLQRKPIEVRETYAWNGETVLVVEDEESLRNVICEGLTAAGCKVLLALDGADGLRVAAEHTGNIDLVLTDVVMPKVSGRELAAALKLKHPESKIVFMSGYAEPAVRKELSQFGSAYIEKPVTLRQLIRVLQSVVKGTPQHV